MALIACHNFENKEKIQYISKLRFIMSAKMIRSKNVEAYCAYCKAVTKMEIKSDAGADAESTKRWAKCKKCKQTLSIDLVEIEKNVKPKASFYDGEKSVTYSPALSYRVGDSIFHEAWNDVGVVVSKEFISNGRSSILVLRRCTNG